MHKLKGVIYVDFSYIFSRIHNTEDHNVLFKFFSRPLKKPINSCSCEYWKFMLFWQFSIKIQHGKVPWDIMCFSLIKSLVADGCFGYVFLCFKLNFFHTVRAPIGENIIEDFSSETPWKGRKNICFANSNFHIFLRGNFVRLKHLDLNSCKF